MKIHAAWTPIHKSVVHLLWSFFFYHYMLKNAVMGPMKKTLIILIYYLFRYVFWYHNQRMINFDSERGIAVTTTPGRRTHSQLSISKAEVSDSVIIKIWFRKKDWSWTCVYFLTFHFIFQGNYTCAPSNSSPASIQVYVSGKIISYKKA